MRFAEVAVDSPVGADRAYTYAVPRGLEVQPGQPVVAPFGPRLLAGVVLDLADAGDGVAVRDLHAALHPDLRLSPVQLRLARWLADRYRCGLFEAAALMLPPGLRQALTFRAVANPSPDAPPLTMAEAALLDLIRRRGPLREAQLRRLWPDPRRPALLQGLERAGRLERSYRWPLPREQAEAPSLAQEAAPAPTPAQARAWEAIRQELAAPAPRPVLLFGVTGSGKTELYLRALEAVVRAGRQAIVLVPEIALTPPTLARFEARFPGRVAALHSGLTPAQRRRAWWRLRSGRAAIALGSRGAIFAPVDRLGLVVLDEEHEWTYKQQDESPHYHAREVALELARQTGALLLLGSATPSLESYHAASTGAYRLLRLPERVEFAGVGTALRGRPIENAGVSPAGGRPLGAALTDLPSPGPRPTAPLHIVSAAPAAGSRRPAETDGAPGLPTVQVVDMRAELRAGNLGLFSRALHGALAETLAVGEQAILFLNRRGSATFVLCRHCGHVLRCRRCETTLTYHQSRAELVCHQCNGRQPAVARCPRCGSGAIRYFGAGTQRVEAELRAAFPGARVLRWDRDTARSVRAHTEVLRRFAAHEADFLVGTQMLAKGLDLPRVTVVGVVSADTLLFLPDFRAGERTFQLLVQVAGRAGRRGWPGRVFIQTYQPEHAAVRAAAGHDYLAFAASELAYRRAHALPPFTRLARLIVLHRDARAAAAEAAALRGRLEALIAEEGLANVDILGPAPAFIARRRGRYRWQIILRGAFEPVLRRLRLGPHCSVDVDPVSVL